MKTLVLAFALVTVAGGVAAATATPNPMKPPVLVPSESATRPASDQPVTKPDSRNPQQPISMRDIYVSAILGDRAVVRVLHKPERDMRASTDPDSDSQQDRLLVYRFEDGSTAYFEDVKVRATIDRHVLTLIEVEGGRHVFTGSPDSISGPAPHFDAAGTIRQDRDIKRAREVTQ